MSWVWKAQCLLQDVALGVLFANLVLFLRPWPSSAFVLVPLANLLVLLSVLDARSKAVFFQPLSWDMTVLGFREWHTIAGAAKYYVSLRFLAYLTLSVTALNGAMFIPAFLGRMSPPTRLSRHAHRLWPIAAAVFCVAGVVTPRRPTQADENLFIGSVVRPLRGSSQSTLNKYSSTLATECDQPLRHGLGTADPQASLRGAAKGRNVLLFIGESWSFDDTSLGDPTTDNTPFLRELAAVGPVAGEAWSQFGHSTKAMVGILTGHYATPGLEVFEASVQRFESAARELGTLGYHTGFFTSQSLIFQNTNMQYRRMGFDDVLDEQSLRAASHRTARNEAVSDQALLDEFDRFLSLREPFFYVIYNANTHQPYRAPGQAPPSETDHQRYERALRFSDSIFRQIVDKLKARALFDRSIVALVGDHGDNFDSTGQMRGRGCELTRREHLVPLVIAAPGLEAPGARVLLDVDRPGRQIDILPTILDLLGVEPTGPIQGRSLLADAPPPALLDGFGSCDRSGIVEGRRKSTFDAIMQRAWRVDLKDDPHERRPVFLDHRATADLRRRLEACNAYNLDQVMGRGQPH